MATEVDTPEQISQKMKEAEDIGLLQPLNVAFNQHHSEETKEPESRHNQPLETSNYVGETTLMVEEKDIELDNETAVDVEADEGKNIFLSPSVPKFTTEETSSEKKDYKASDIPNLAEREMTKNETLVEEIDHAEIRPSEEGQEDKNERADVLKSTEDVCISTEIEPSYNQNEEKVIEKGQGTEVSTPLINELIEDTTAEKTAPDKGGEKIDETFGKKDLVSTEDKTQFKPEICQNEMESETTVKMSKKEAGTKDESTEKIVMADSKINTRISDDENPDSTEATTRDYEDGEELTAVMDEHKNEAEEHSKTETSKQEEHSEQRYWPENEPRKQDPERFLDVASEEIQKTTTDHDQTITYSEEQSLPASLEGNLEEEKKERTIHADEIEDSNIPEEKVRIIQYKSHFHHDENPDSTEATTRDYEDSEELTAVMDEHKNEAEEHSKTETSKQEEHSEQRYWPENEPRKQDPERFLDVASEEIQKTTNTDHDQTITYSEEQSLPASLEGNLEEEKKERTIHADEIEDSNIPEEKVLETNEGRDKLEPILNKTADSDSSTKSLEKSVQEISQEVEEREEHESAGVNKETEEVNIKQTAYEDIHSSAAGKVNVEENFKQEETNATEVKEEDKKSETECIEQKFDSTCPTEETKDETLKEEVKPKNVHDTQCTEVTLEETSATETKEDLVGNSSDSQVIEKETQDEILEKGEDSVTGVANKKILKKVEQEDEMQLEIPDLASEEKGLVTTGLCEAVSNDTDIVNEAGKKQEHQLLNEKSEAGNSCTDTEKVVLEQDTSAEASRSSLIKYVEIEKAVVELETEDHIQKTEDFATEDTNTIEEGNLELHGQLRSVSELVAQDQQNETLPEISVKDHNMECSGERIISQDLQKGELEKNKEVELAENHTSSTHDHIEIMKDVVLGEEVHGAVELAEESESFKEQHVREESCMTETQKQSALAETVNEIKEPYPVTTVNLQATNFRENEETASHVMEDLNREPEAFTITKTPEGNDEGTEKVDINITSSGIEDPTDRFEEENKEEADNFNGKMEAVPVRMITEVTSLEEIHLDDKSVLALDSTPDNSSLEMKSSDTTLDSAESDSPNLGESSGKISEHANPDEETGIVKIPDADEVEVEKAETFDAATNSKEQKFGDILEIGESLDRTDTCKLEKEPNKVLEATAESKYQGVEAVIEGEVTSHQTLPTGDLRQPLIDPSSEIPPKEEDREPTPIEKCEDKSRRNNVMLVNEVSEAFATDTEQETCLHKENSREIEVSRTESKFIENKEDDRSDTATKEEGIALLKSTSSKPEENVSMIECIEESFDTTCLSKETIAEVPKDETKSDQNCKTKGEPLLRNPTESQVSVKETKDEILENVELEVTDITEETSLKNFEQGIIQLNSTELAFEGKGLVITGLQETGPADVDVKAELAQASEMDENKGMRIPTAVTDEVYGAGEETEQEPENQTLNKLPKVEDERNITTVEALRSDVTGEGHKESSAQASSENKLVTTEASETANVTSENVEASNNFNKKNSESTEPSEQVHGAFQLAEESESENMKEQLVREESFTTELQTQSASAETINEIKESNPITIVNLQATDFIEIEETISQTTEDLIQESEAYIVTKPPEEGNDEGIEKHIGVTSSELEVSGELFKEENKEEPDNINAEMDAAPVGLIKEETSREEIHLDGSPVLAPEVENPETSNAATNSKELNVEDIPENGENLDTSDIYKVEKDSTVLETIAESKFQVVESDKSRKNDEMLVNEIAEHSFATNTKQETFLQNESSRELEVSKSEREFVGNIDDDMYKATASEPEENVSKTECAEHNSNATCHREETIAQAPKDEAKCNRDCQTKVETVMGEQTSTGSQVLEEETKEEILQDVELTDTGISEETSLKKVEQEDVVQLNSTDLASEDKGLVITGLQGTGSDDFDMKAELAQASETDKNKDIQIPKPVTDEVYGAGEETEHEQENEIPNELPKVEDERNITTVESDVMEEDHKESSAQASRENKVVTTEVSETVNVPSENVRASYKGTPSEYDEREEKLVQIEEKSVDSSGDTDIVSTDREKSSAHEETHDEDKDPCTIPVLNSKKKITKSEQEDSLENSESNLTEDVEVEKAVELKAGDVSRETEGSEASTSILSEKNLESTGSCEQFRVTSVSVTENQSSKSLPQTSVKDQKSGSTEEKITEQDFQENQMGRKQEVQLTSDDEKQINRGQDQTEIIKDVISTEEVPGRFQKAEESDNIKEEIIKKESFPTELHKASRLTETGCEVTDSEPLPTVNFEPAEFSQHSETVNSQAAEDRNRVSEASSNIETPEEEMKAFIEKPITITSSAGQKDDAKESVIVENLDIKFEGEEIEISDAVSNPKEQVVEDILGPERSLTMDGTGTYKPEEKINEVSEAICEPNYQGDKEVIEGDIVNTQTLPAGDSIYQLVEQSSAMELEPNKRNDSPDEPKKEERITLEEATSVETKGNFSELRLDESLLDCTRDIELKEDMSKSEEMEMKEEHPKAITTQEAEENQSEKANDSNDITKSKISSEQTLEEKEVVMDSPMVSPSEETFGKSSQEDDVQMIENYAETTDQKGETMKNTILNEQLSEELERATAAGDRADEDQHHSSVGNISLPHEEKNVEEVPIKVDLQEKNDGKDSGETDIEETILSKEEDNSSKVDLVKIGEDISVSGDKETVIRTDEGQNSDFELPPVTDVVAEEAPREEVEEVSEPAPKEHSHETFETYNVKDETENTNGSESLVDDTKSKNTPLESALDRNGVLEEQEPSASKLHISSPTESLNEEVADKEIRNTGDEKHNDLMSEEQERDEVSIPEKGIHVKDNGAHVEHEEPIDVLTKGGRMKLDDVESDSPMTANEDGETKDQNEKLNASPHTKDSENEVSKEDGTVDVKNCSEISQDKEKDHLAIPDKQILIEPAANESTMAKISTGNKDVPIVQQLTSGNFLGAEPKAKEVACQEEKNTSTDLAKFSSQDNLQGSSEEASQVAEDLTKERSLPENIEDPQADNTETAEVDEQKKDEDKDEEEEGDENKRVDSGYDAPVMVEASRDMDMKVSPPKKSHSILSGVGSKVKHSISKVKKVITGKSSHPKPPSPK